jgi:hypothetical protein
LIRQQRVLSVAAVAACALALSFAAGAQQKTEISITRQPGLKDYGPSPDVIGGPLTQSQFFITTTFAKVNPKVIAAIKAAITADLPGN